MHSSMALKQCIKLPWTLRVLLPSYGNSEDVLKCTDKRLTQAIIKALGSTWEKEIVCYDTFVIMDRRMLTALSAGHCWMYYSCA